MKKICLTALIIFVLIFALIPTVQAQSPQETLNQYISDLQKNPNDNALREKVINHVQWMKPKPVMSTEAEKYEGRAEYAIKNAKNEADFLDAAKEYDKALLLAPWVSSYYFNQAIAYEKAGKPKEAKRSFEFYLLAAPNAQDARDVRKRIAGLEYAAEKAARESSPAAIAEKKKSMTATEIKREGRFIAYDNGTVLDTRTNLMWAEEDSGSNINWYDAKSYCENYRGGGYTDWRMPTLDELAGLYDARKSRLPYGGRGKLSIHVATKLIGIDCYALWSSTEDKKTSEVIVSFNFVEGERNFFPKSMGTHTLPVRSGK